MDHGIRSLWSLSGRLDCFECSWKWAARSLKYDGPRSILYHHVSPERFETDWGECSGCDVSSKCHRIGCTISREGYKRMASDERCWASIPIDISSDWIYKNTFEIMNQIPLRKRQCSTRMWTSDETHTYNISHLYREGDSLPCLKASATLLLSIGTHEREQIVTSGRKTSWLVSGTMCRLE